MELMLLDFHLLQVMLQEVILDSMNQELKQQETLPIRYGMLQDL